MANNPYMLPTLAGNGYGVPAPVKPPTPNPVRGGGSDPRYLPPAGGGLPPQPWGVNNHVQGNPLGGGMGTGGVMGGMGLSPFSNPASSGAAGGGIYRPNPVGNTAGYAYLPRQFEADANVDTGSAFYKQNMGAYTPTDPEAQKIWAVFPVQDKLELSSWARAGGGAFSDAILQAFQAGPNAVVIDKKYMSGTDAVEYIKTKARAYMDAIAKARQQSQQPPQTPNRITVGS